MFLAAERLIISQARTIFWQPRNAKATFKVLGPRELRPLDAPLASGHFTRAKRKACIRHRCKPVQRAWPIARPEYGFLFSAHGSEKRNPYWRER
jgi:hypothetical protein